MYRLKGAMSNVFEASLVGVKPQPNGWVSHFELILSSLGAQIRLPAIAAGRMRRRMSNSRAVTYHTRDLVLNLLEVGLQLGKRPEANENT